MGMYSTDFRAGTIRDGEGGDIFFTALKKKKEKKRKMVGDNVRPFF